MTCLVLLDLVAPVDSSILSQIYVRQYSVDAQFLEQDHQQDYQALLLCLIALPHVFDMRRARGVSILCRPSEAMSMGTYDYKLSCPP